MKAVPPKKKKKPRPSLLKQHLGRDGAAARQKRPPLQQLMVVLAFVVLVAMLTRTPGRALGLLESVNTGEVPKEDIRSTTFFESVDLAKTKAAQELAASGVPDHYRVDLSRVQERLEALDERIAFIETQRPEAVQIVLDALRASTSSQTAEEVVSKAITAFATMLKTQEAWAEYPDAAQLAEWLKPDVDSLPERLFAAASEAVEAADRNDGEGSAADVADGARPVVALEPPAPELRFTSGELLRELSLEGLRYVLIGGVRSDSITPAAAERPVVLLRATPLLDQQASVEKALGEVPDTATAIETLGEQLVTTAKRAARDTGTPNEWAKLQEAALAITRPQIAPTLQLDDVATAGAKEQARQNVLALTKEIAAGEKIQGGGERWNAQSISDFKTYLELLQDEERPGERVLGAVLSHMILVALVLLGLHKASQVLGGDSKISRRTKVNLALLLMCSTLIAGRAVSYFEPSGFVLPVAAAGILFAILVSVPLAAATSVLTAFLVSAQYNYDWRLFAVASGMSLAGAFSIYRVRRRSDMAGASLKAIVVGLLIMLAITLAMDSLFSEAALRRLALIAFNGCICLVVVPGLLSPLERLFGITTDIQLLEYSDLNNEVLSLLAIEVPGTYAHSLLLGQIAEAAADAIGGNGLMARVCAYYHDIGKMRRPEYFSENQRGRNIHDELSPRLSARAIASHVLQGAGMAREYHLPRPIVDGILEHHGTCLIGYFYQQALEQQKHGDVREEDFRYPGPKPQSPETAILMICDASESGVRSIKNPNEERVREFVEKIIASRSADRQFDECNLTLKQLNTIAEVVSRRLISNMHTRVAYPDLKTEEKTEAPLVAAQGE